MFGFALMFCRGMGGWCRSVISGFYGDVKTHRSLYGRLMGAYGAARRLGGVPTRYNYHATQPQYECPCDPCTAM